MFTLRDDQSTFVSDLSDAFRKHQSVLGVAPTGFGKTVVSGEVAKRSTSRGKNVVFTVHRENLISQTSKTFREFGLPHGFIAANQPYHRGDSLHIASIDTLKRRLKMVKAPDLLVVDESHLAMAEGWQLVVDFYRKVGTKILGNSASPMRLDGRPLRSLFDVMVEGPGVRWLMDQGFLSDYEYYAPDVPDLAKIGRKGWDYNQRDAGEEMARPKLIGSVVRHYKKLARGKRAVCFCMNVEHSLRTVEEFRANGVPAAHIDANTPLTERRRILNDLADGRIWVVCNVELITTGFDLSSQVGRDVPVECVILCRPTMSLALFLQMVGRALRRKPYPAIILDHAGNSAVHGYPDDEREWSLDGDEKSKGKREGPLPPITCGGCFRQVRRPAPPCCPSCGKPLIIMAEPKPIEVADGDLHLQTDEDKARQRAARKQEENDATTLHDLVELARKRGYANPQGWAFKKWSNSTWRRRSVTGVTQKNAGYRPPASQSDASSTNVHGFTFPL